MRTSKFSVYPLAHLILRPCCNWCHFVS